MAPLLVKYNGKTTLLLVVIFTIAANLALEYLRFGRGIDMPLIVRGSAPFLLLFFYMGIFLSAGKRNYPLWIPVVMMLAGLAAGLWQMHWLQTHLGISATGQKLSLFLFDAGFILFCLSSKAEAAYRDNRLTRAVLYVGGISFGIYFTHIYLIWLFEKYAPALHACWWASWLACTALTILFIAAVKRLAPAAARRYLGYR